MKKILIIIISISLTILSAEAFLHWVSPIYFCNTVSQFQYDKELGVVTKPNFKKSMLTDHIIEVFTNDIGSRNYLNKDELLQYEKIIFCVGDSYTEGVGNLTDASYPFYLDLLLNKNNNTYEKKFAVFNLGLAAYGSIQSFLVCKTYKEKIGKFPDVIIYFICSNDIVDDVRFKDGYRHRHVVSGSPHYHPIIVALNETLETSQLYIRIKRLFDSIYNNTITPEQFVPEQLPGLIDMIAFSKRNNIKLIISYTDYESTIYNLIKEYAIENNILFSDYRLDVEGMNAVFNELPVNNRHSGGHFRSWVNFIIAENFAALSEDNQ